MNIRKKFLNLIDNSKSESFYSYLSARISARLQEYYQPSLRRLRYRLVGLLYGQMLYIDPIEVCQLEYFCDEIAKQTAARRASLLNKEVQSLLEAARSSLSNGSSAECLSLLDKAKALDSNHPDLPELYRNYSRQIYEEVGSFKNICVKARLTALELEKKQHAGSCFNLDSTKVLDHSWTAFIGHMGHLAQFIQLKQLGLLPKDNYIVLANTPANNCYLSYLSSCQGINILTKEDTKEFHDYCFHTVSEDLSVWELKDGYKNYLLGSSIAAEKWKLEKRSPLLKIKDDHREKGLKILKELSIPADAWFVALHVRSGYAFRENLRDGRNCEIDSYIPAIKAITDAGGYVFRMGDSSMKPLPEMSNVVDYAFSPYKSDWMDVFLWACCKFFIGTQSGPLEIPNTFGIPVLFTNAASFGLVSAQRHNALMLPKLWYSKAEQRLLTFSEILSCSAGWCERRTLGDDLVLVENSVDELEAGVREMLELTKNGVQEDQYEIVKDPLNPLQVKLDTIREKYNAYGKLPLSRSFLDKYAHLVN